MGERRYSEKEVSEILRQASALQASGSSSSGDGAGLTLSEIERIAGDVGIEPTYIASAALKISSGTAQTRRFWLGGAARRMVQERLLDGELDDSAWGDVVAELRSGFRCTGSSSAIGSAREWIGGSNFVAIHFSATPRDGRTRCRFSLNQTDGMAVAWLLVFLATFCAATLLACAAASAHLRNGGVAMTLMVVLAVVGVFYGITNALMARWSLRNSKALESTMAKVEAIITSRDRSTSPASVETASAIETPTHAFH